MESLSAKDAWTPRSPWCSRRMMAWTSAKIPARRCRRTTARGTTPSTGASRESSSRLLTPPRIRATKCRRRMRSASRWGDNRPFLRPLSNARGVYRLLACAYDFSNDPARGQGEYRATGLWRWPDGYGARHDVLPAPSGPLRVVDGLDVRRHATVRGVAVSQVRAAPGDRDCPRGVVDFAGSSVPSAEDLQGRRCRLLYDQSCRRDVAPRRGDRAGIAVAHRPPLRLAALRADRTGS